MALIDFSRQEIIFKIVYYGPALSGKTTNLQFIFSAIPEKIKGQFTSIATETERTLFFDFLPVELGTIKGFKVRLSLYTVPGQELYKLTRKSVLRAVDGIVFVADSTIERKNDNIESFLDMKNNLEDFNLNDIPIIFQFNKRDLVKIISIEDLVTDLKINAEEYHEGVAIKGIGVMECLKAITREVAKKI